MRMLVVTGSFPAVTQTFVTREVEAASKQHEVHVLAARPEPAAASLPPELQQRLHVLDWRRVAPIPWPPLAWTRRVGLAARRQIFGRVLGLRRRRYFGQLLSTSSLGRIDLIHAHWTEHAQNVAVPLGELFDVPVTCTVHDSFLPDVSTHTLKELQRTVHTIVMVSSWSLRHWRERTGSAERLVLVPNGVDLPADLTSVRPEGVPVVVNVARCEAHKRQPDLLHAIAQLRHDDVKVRCVIVGAGPEQANLRQLARDLGIADDCEFTGALPHPATLDTIARSDIFVLPSARESFGVVTAEAMAAGLPVVATEVGGSVDLVEEGVTGYLVPPGDPSAIASRLRILLENRELRKALGDAGRRRVGERFSFARHMDSMLAVWNDAVRTHRLSC